MDYLVWDRLEDAVIDWSIDMNKLKLIDCYIDS